MKNQNSHVNYVGREVKKESIVLPVLSLLILVITTPVLNVNHHYLSTNSYQEGTQTSQRNTNLNVGERNSQVVATTALDHPKT